MEVPNNNDVYIFIGTIKLIAILSMAYCTGANLHLLINNSGGSRGARGAIAPYLC